MAFKENTIDASAIPTPQVSFTERAMDQLQLIINNDFTLAGKYFRILVSGKGCDGFTYSTGFTDIQDNDFLIKVANSNQDIQVLMDPFAAFYLQETSIDFIQDFQQDAEGFVVVNHGQAKYAGKFWRSKEELVPPLQADHN